MHTEPEKCVVIIDGSLPPGAAANAAAILGVTLGRKLPDITGPDVTDRAGRAHAGIIRFPVPILTDGREAIRALREKLFTPEFAGLATADFTDLAQGCRTYEEYAAKMAAWPEDKLSYIGLAVCGGRKQVSRLTGNMPLLR